MAALLAIVDIVTDVFGGVLTWLFIGILGFLLDIYRRFKNLRNDVDDLQRYVLGDSENPDTPGLLEKVDKIDNEVCGLREDMEQQHRETDRKLNQLLDNDR
ncbi:hypothetical protein OSG_eHP36_00200 [environmental Halophage eHP-36]|nr:hypothetical protein OSG_eHP36_00200 [environmental Halophage eHP-36]